MIHSQIKTLLFNKNFYDSFFSLLIKVSSAALLFLLFISIARNIDTDQFGIFGIIFSLSAFLSVICNQGLTTLITRLWPELKIRGREKNHSILFAWSFKKIIQFLLIASALNYLIFLLISKLIPHTYFNLNFSYSVILLTSSMSISDLIASTLRAQKKLFIALLPKDIFWKIISLIFLLIISHKNQILDAYSVAICMALILLFISLLQLLISGLFKYLSLNFFTKKSLTKQLSNWDDLSKPIWISSILFAASLHIDMVVGSFFIKPETLAMYFSAVRIASLLALPIMAINQLSGPLISEYFHSNKMTKLKSLLKTYSAFIALLMIPTFASIILFGKELLLLFGEDYDAAYSLLIMLCFAYFFHTFTGPAAIFLQMSGNSKFVLNTSLITQSLSIILMFTLVGIYGIYAIALIKILEIGARNLIHVFNGYKLYRINTSLTNIFFK